MILNAGQNPRLTAKGDSNDQRVGLLLALPDPWKDWFLRRTGGWMLHFRCFEHEFRGFHRWFPCTEEDQQVFGRFKPPNLRLKALVTHWSWHIQYQCNRFLYFKLGPARRLGPPRKQPVPIKSNTWTSSKKFRWCHFPQKSAVFLCYRRISSWQFLEVDNTRVSALGSVNPLFGTLMGRLFRGPFGWTLPSGHTNPVCPRYELPSSYQHGAHIFWALGNTAAGVGIVIHTSRNKVLDTAAHTHKHTCDWHVPIAKCGQSWCERQLFY